MKDFDFDLQRFKDISNYKSNKEVSGTSYADYIYNSGSNVTINCGDGDDSIYNNYGNNVTISGGMGNDSVDNRGISNAYVYTGGNDTIQGFDQFSTLVIANSYTTLLQELTDEDGYFDGYNVIITVKGKGTITLVDYWEDSVNIVSSLSKIKPLNVIKVEKDNESVTGTSGNDYISLSGITYNTSINAGAGNDYMSLSGITYNTDYRGFIAAIIVNVIVARAAVDCRFFINARDTNGIITFARVN